MSARGNPIIIVCAACASENVSRDAWAEWDKVNQEWMLRMVFDTAYCHRCDSETRLEELPIIAKSA